jgi:hypothetical protein
MATCRRYARQDQRTSASAIRANWPVTHMDELTLKDPFPARIPFGELRG